MGIDILKSGLEPVTGQRRDILDAVQAAALDLIRVVEIEKLGVSSHDALDEATQRLTGYIRDFVLWDDSVETGKVPIWSHENGITAVELSEEEKRF